MCKTRSAKVLLVAFILCLSSMFLAPISAAQRSVQAVEEEEMINISDAINLVDTTLNSVEEIQSILGDLMMVAIHLGHGSYSTIQRALMNDDFQEYINEIDLVVESTEYNGFKMLDDSIESIAVRQMRKSFRIKGVDMTQTSLGLDDIDLDISTPQPARLAVVFISEAMAIAEQARVTYIEYFIRLKHLPTPNRKIDRQDDDLLPIDQGMALLQFVTSYIEGLFRQLVQFKGAIIYVNDSSSETMRVIMDSQLRSFLDTVDLDLDMSNWGMGFDILKSSTGTITIRLNGKPLVVEKVDITLAGLGLDREDLNILTIPAAEEALEDIEGAMDLLMSTYETYYGYLAYLATSK